MWAYKHRGRASAPDGGSRSDLAADPNDPDQGFADHPLDVSGLSVDAVDFADAEAARDLAMLESELDESALEPSDAAFDSIDAALVGNIGELYGVHTAPAVDLTLTDDRLAMNDGQNWVEALQETVIEYGADSEHEIDPISEIDNPQPAGDLGDRPVADRGSGGPGGV